MIKVHNGQIICSSKKIINNGTIEGNETISLVDETDKSRKLNNHFDTIIDATNCIVMPGFIETHINGAYGVDMLDCTENVMNTLSQNLPKEGVTAFIGTSVTAAVQTLNKLADVIGNYHQPKNCGATFLGWHVEGPFISKTMKGAHTESQIIKFNWNYLKNWIVKSNHKIKLLTYAPEEANINLVNHVKDTKIVLSFGHSNAQYTTCEQHHQKLGVNHITHLYNACSKYEARNPGVVPWALATDSCYAEQIVDGIHICKEIIALTYKLKGAKQIILVTDANRAKGMKDGIYRLGDMKFQKIGNKATIVNTNMIAGSVASYDFCVQNFKNWTNCSWNELVLVTSENAAKVFNLYDNMGEIVAGKQTNLVILDKKMHVMCTICHGEIAYLNQSFKTKINSPLSADNKN